MNEARFADIVAAYGAAPDQWPAGERRAALALAGRSPEAAALLREAAILDEALASSRPGTSPATLARMRQSIAREVSRLPSGPVQRYRFVGVLEWLEPFAPAGVGALAVLVAAFAWIAWGNIDQETVMTGPQTLSLVGSLL